MKRQKRMEAFQSSLDFWFYKSRNKQVLNEGDSYRKETTRFCSEAMGKENRQKCPEARVQLSKGRTCGECRLKVYTLPRKMICQMVSDQASDYFPFSCRN